MPAQAAGFDGPGVGARGQALGRQAAPMTASASPAESRASLHMGDPMPPRCAHRAALAATGYARHQLRLHVGADGRAIGRFHGGCGYMMMRSQRSTWNAHHADQARTSTSLLDPRAITTADPGLHLLLAARQPGVTHLVLTDPIDGTSSLLMFQADRSDGSWAAAGHLTDRTTCITQYGY